LTGSLDAAAAGNNANEKNKQRASILNIGIHLKTAIIRAIVSKHLNS
jgi:hypothetical protein